MTGATTATRVLYVGDDREFADALAGSLERRTGAAAVEAVASVDGVLDRLQGVDCVVSERTVGDREGTAVLAAVRERHPDVPFVLCVEDDRASVADAVVGPGPTDVFRKDGGSRTAVLANRVLNYAGRTSRGDDAPSDGLEYVLDHTGSVVFHVDPETGATSVEGAFERLFGVAPDAVEPGGEFVERVVYPEDRAAVGRFVERIREGDPDDDAVEYRTNPENGPVRWIRTTVSVADRDDGTERIVGVSRDVTDRKERKRERDRYETLLETMPDTAVVADTDGRFVEIHGHQGWSGYSTEELLGEHISMTTTPESLEKSLEAVKRLFHDDDLEKTTYEYDIVTKDGEVIPHENHIALLPPDEDGRIPGSLSVLRDISERKERERELRERNERLDRFASMVSHDLRNPLEVANAGLELARQDCDSEHLTTTAEAHERMERLIDDLLALAREGDRAMDPRPVELGPFVEGCWENVAGDATLVVETDRTLRADPDRLRQLFGNLLRNAVEHGGEDVRITVGDVDDGFYVADDGPGISESEREAVFEAGYSTGGDGVGLGLELVANVAGAHGWSVRATESEDGGARVEVTGVGTGAGASEAGSTGPTPDR